MFDGCAGLAERMLAVMTMSMMMSVILSRSRVSLRAMSVGVS